MTTIREAIEAEPLPSSDNYAAASILFPNGNPSTDPSAGMLANMAAYITANATLLNIDPADVIIVSEITEDDGAVRKLRYSGAEIITLAG